MRRLRFPPAGTGKLTWRRIRCIQVAGTFRLQGCVHPLKKGIEDGGEALTLSAEPQKGKYVALNKRLMCVWEEEKEDNNQVFLRETFKCSCLQCQQLSSICDPCLGLVPPLNPR